MILICIYVPEKKPPFRHLNLLLPYPIGGLQHGDRDGPLYAPVFSDVRAVPFFTLENEK